MVANICATDRLRKKNLKYFLCRLEIAQDAEKQNLPGT